MCLALIARGVHPRYPLIIAANRDEFYDRPTAPAGFWDNAPEILAGRDLEARGTWLGVTRRGRFALLTNYREGGAKRRGSRSRGLLVADFLRGDTAPEAYCAHVAADDAAYDGYNLVVGDPRACAYHSNRTRESRLLGDGIYGLSNHLLDSPWPKVERTKRALAGLLDRDGEDLVEGLFGMLRDPSRAADHELPRTGVTLEWERLLSSAFIASDTYGTRCATVALVEGNGSMRFVERSFLRGGDPGAEVRYAFEWSL